MRILNKIFCKLGKHNLEIDRLANLTDEESHEIKATYACTCLHCREAVLVSIFLSYGKFGKYKNRKEARLRAKQLAVL